MFRSLLAAALFLLGTGTGTALSAQRRTLMPGDEVQVRAPLSHRGPFRGEVVRYVQDTLEVREHASGSVYTMPLRDIRYLSRNEGMNRRRSFRRGVQAGAFVGVAIGVVAGPLIAAGYGEDDDFGRNVALSSVSGLAVGTSLGALVGALFPRNQWQRFHMAPPPACGSTPCPPQAPAPVTAPE